MVVEEGWCWFEMGRVREADGARSREDGAATGMSGEAGEQMEGGGNCYL